jgi:hypothetical protein
VIAPSTPEEWTRLLADCLDSVADRMGRERLGYLAATSKVELQVRDELAFGLHQTLPDAGWQVCREWPPGHRALAVIGPAGEPLMELEAKALYDFDAASATKRAQFLTGGKSSHGLDVAKLVASVGAGTPCYLLSLVTNLQGSVPLGSLTAVKYAVAHNASVKAHGTWAALAEAAQVWRRDLATLGPVAHEIEWDGGEVYGIRVSVTAYLVGPLQPAGV